MNEQRLTSMIRQSLDQGLASLPPEACRRLQVIRRQALTSQQGESRRAGTFSQTWLKPALITLALAIPVALAGFYLKGQYEIGEMAVLDRALLLDDLPPEAFTDPGFRAWLDSES